MPDFSRFGMPHSLFWMRIHTQVYGMPDFSRFLTPDWNIWWWCMLPPPEHDHRQTWVCLPQNLSMLRNGILRNSGCHRYYNTGKPNYIPVPVQGPHSGYRRLCLNRVFWFSFLMTVRLWSAYREEINRGSVKKTWCLKKKRGGGFKKEREGSRKKKRRGIHTYIHKYV